MRSKIGHWLRKYADRIDYKGAPRYTSYTFTFETGEGIRFRDDGRGCRLWYLGEAEYDKAHNESDSAKADADLRRIFLVGVNGSQWNLSGYPGAGGAGGVVIGEGGAGGGGGGTYTPPDDGMPVRR